MKNDPVQLFALVRDEAWSQKGTWSIKFISDFHKKEKELNQSQINDLMNSIISEMINASTPTYVQFKYSQLCSLLYNEDSQKYISVFEENKEIVQKYCDNVGNTSFEQAAKQYISNIIPKLPSSNSGPSLHQPIKWMTIESQGPRLGRPPELTNIANSRQIHTFPKESSFSPPTLNQSNQPNQNSSTKWIPLSTKIQEERINHKGARASGTLKSYSNFSENSHSKPRLSVSPKNPKALYPDDPRFTKCYTPSPSHVQKTDINSVLRMKLDTDVPIKPRVEPVSRFGRSPSFYSDLIATTTTDSPLTPPPEEQQKVVSTKSDNHPKSDSPTSGLPRPNLSAKLPGANQHISSASQNPAPIPAGLKMPDGSMSGPPAASMSVPKGLKVPNNAPNDGGLSLLVSSSPGRTSSPGVRFEEGKVPPSIPAGLKMPDGKMSGIPSGLKMPDGSTSGVPEGKGSTSFQLPSGLKMPDGSTSGQTPPKIPAGLKMPDGSTSGVSAVPPGLKMPDGSTSGLKMPSGIPAGLKMPDGTVTGAPNIPPGLKMPDGTMSGQTSVPPGLKMPDGSTSGLKVSESPPKGIQSGPTLPPGLKMPDGTVSGGAPIPSGLKMPDGTLSGQSSVPPGLKMPDGSTSGSKIPSGLKMPNGTVSGVPAGLKMPDGSTSGQKSSGPTLPAGLKMPDGTVSGPPSVPPGLKMPDGSTSGATIPSGLKMPDGTVSGVPAGLKMPGGNQNGAQNASSIPPGLKMPDGSTSGSTTLPIPQGLLAAAIASTSPKRQSMSALGVPPGLKMPDGTLNGATIPSGLKMPDGTVSGAPNIPPGLKMPDGSTSGPKVSGGPSTLPAGLKMPDGSVSGGAPIPSGLKMPDGSTSGLKVSESPPKGIQSGPTLPPGLKMPDGTISGAPIPPGLKMLDGSTSGSKIPSGLKMPNGTVSGVPAGLKMPDGTVSGAPIPNGLKMPGGSTSGQKSPGPSVPAGLKMPDGTVSGQTDHFRRSDLGDLMRQFGPPSAGPARPEDIVPNPQEMKEFLPQRLDATPPIVAELSSSAPLPPQSEHSDASPSVSESASESDHSSGSISPHNSFTDLPVSSILTEMEGDMNDYSVANDSTSQRKQRRLSKSASMGIGATQTLHMSDLVRAHHHHVIGHGDNHSNNQ